jgi:hypothetical protein
VSVELPAEPSTRDLAQQRGPNHWLDADASSPGGKKRQQVKNFIALSRKRWMTSDASSWRFRQEMRKDQLFASGGGNQWEQGDREARNAQSRPCIEINRIPQFIRQVSNQNRANRSSIIVHARSKGATTVLANALQALIRSVEVESDADVAYDTATQHQLTSGLGFVRLMAKWAHDEAFEQVCRIARLRNPLSVYWDPATQEADFSDMRWCQIVAAFGKDEVEEKYGKFADYQSITEYLGGGSQRMDDWMPEGKVILVEYYYLEEVERTLLRMDTGQNIYLEDLEDFRLIAAMANPGGPEPQVVRERQVMKKAPFWCLHNAIDILEGNEDRTGGRQLPGSRIPIFPVMGDEYDIDGTIDYRGMVRDAREPQRMYNFWSSCIAEAVALAPKSPWVAAKGQVEDNLEDWANSNRVPKAVLTYNPKAVGDHLIPPPQRNTVEPAIQAMVAGLAEANQDLMSVMGLFEPSLGQRGSHSESGKARELLQQQGVAANSNFLDNLQRTKRSIGRALLEWAPVVYDVPRIVHLVMQDGKKQAAVIYAGAANKPDPSEFPDIKDMYDVGMGHYDVTVSTGPSYQTQKEATQAWLLDLFKVLPQLAAVGADILLENSDDPAAQQLAKRAKKALPPQFQDESDPEAQVPILQAKVMQQGQLLELANKAIASMSRALEAKELDNDTKKEIAVLNNTAKMAIEAAKLGNQKDMALLSAELERHMQIVDLIHADTVQDMERDNQTAAQAHDHQSKVAQIREQRDASVALAEQDHALNPPPEPEAGGADA